MTRRGRGAARPRRGRARPTDPAALVRRAEGWPAALYLAALVAARPPAAQPDRGARRRRRARRLTTCGDEVLTQLPPAGASFLRARRSSPGRPGPLCDAVLQAPRLGAVLRDLARANPPSSRPMDRDGTAITALLADMLRAELRRRRPRPAGAAPPCRRLARARGDIVPALDHAIAAGDAAPADSSGPHPLSGLWQHGPQRGGPAWLDRFTGLETRPARRSRSPPPTSQLARGTGPHGALDGEPGPPATSEAARLRRTRPGEAVAALRRLCARASRARPRTPSAPRLLRRGRRVGDRSPAPPRRGAAPPRRPRPRRRRSKRAPPAGGSSRPSPRVLCLAQLALLAVDDDDWAPAAMHARAPAPRWSAARWRLPHLGARPRRRRR